MWDHEREMSSEGQESRTRAPAWLGAVASSLSTWARRGRQVGFVGTSLLLVWEIRITAMAGQPALSSLFRIGMVLVLYGLPRWPQATALLSLPLLVGEYLTGLHHLSITVLVPLVIAAYLVATKPRYRGYLYALACVALITMLPPMTDLMSDIIGWTVVFLVPCVFGEILRHARTTIERIRHVTEEQLRNQRRMVARELHDTSIHDITALIMALERAKLHGVSDPELLAEIDHAAAMARQSVVSMRGVLAILRDEGSTTLSDARTLTGRPDEPRTAVSVRRALQEAEEALERAGHTPQVHVHAEDGIESTLPSSVELALARVVQECAANMIKYAKPGTSCALMVERTASATNALFINEYDGRRQADAAMSSGLGLIGIKERVAVVGGTVTITTDDERWMVQVSIPLIASTTEGQPSRALQP